MKQFILFTTIIAWLCFFTSVNSYRDRYHESKSSALNRAKRQYFFPSSQGLPIMTTSQFPATGMFSPQVPATRVLSPQVPATRVLSPQVQVPATRVFSPSTVPATVVSQPRLTLVSPPAATTVQIAVPQPAPVSFPIAVPHSESYVFQSGPTYTYQLHQRHPVYVNRPAFAPSWGWA